MARGITESDVHTAADELVANGDRPTVERIRAHLGTGSPNTVTRWLDTWWKNLGIRLQPKRPDLKDAPAVLAELAGQWWALALQHARESALEELANARQSLAVEYEELRMQQQNFADEGSALHAKATASAQSERLALTQVAELRQLIDQLQAQLAESARQHASTDQRLEQAESARRVVEARSQELQELARSERESLMEHANSVEDRAAREIDQARQHAKDLQTKLASAEKLHAATEQSLREALSAAQDAVRAAVKEADRQRVKSEVLEEQLARIPKVIEEAFRAKDRQGSAKSRKKAPKG
ncbi:cointegrate resolution protein T [Stenotrophomonas acidaminiphila]|uniref:DNA-binding protein n=1 Tax=Stenotrophomonas TaxID=40323 RepID=UPI0013756B7D|nr:DNA-binding protein [Stenotrophomonas acidaminiphila]NCT87554.1 cointegrate resolution protein T [Stenotrophomonas acidaminiphila]